ncbi:phosphoenolpyruvate--protein phosphotransferase [Paenibacillus hemerocallicola]|uniref:Phosphoenolpyruvate-protein phosphotransferase n=1 Tax=Paenibacillus hemerocallicola TaxID=1172614 RepID=A0A5C4TDJ0_9BACL|nr:phosphoenolpyruvate--protein phosphotransferase [Paenibacillus hemerocallicola]TNJ67154.1 phosphoenolpyruvate--protein phosphotransferase [Paenibacillus hemerocallicola]
MVKGNGGAVGIAIGKAFVLPDWEWELSDSAVDVNDMAFEFERLHEGVRISKTELQQIKQEIAEVLGVEESNIFDAHLAILEDPVFMNEVAGIIQRQYKAAEVAVKEVVDKFVNMFDLLDDEYMKERALDIKDVGTRLLKHLLGAFEETKPPEDQPFVIVARELTPSQLAHLDSSQLLGIVTATGGKTSHTAIMARAMGIPFVFGIDGGVQTGDMLVVDGESGDVYVNPDEPIVETYRERRQRLAVHRERLQTIVDIPSVTKDGREVNLSANIASLQELEQALKQGAKGVGLFRTEMLYMDGTTWPKENEQFEVYRSAAQKLQGKPLIIRTLDIGGDKQLDYISLPEEENPVLGYRGIRISIDRRDMFKTQLKAILRASEYGNIKILLPMISSVEEVRRAREVLELAMQELRASNVPFNGHVPVGIMIEVPAAVAIADMLAQEVQFFSIGTNDLVQYVLAVDRMNEKISHLYEPYHPAVLRMLKLTVEAASRQGISVSVCGELAGDADALPIWLGLGVHELSMAGQSILDVKSRLIDSSELNGKQLLERLLACRTSAEMKALLHSGGSDASRTAE